MKKILLLALGIALGSGLTAQSFSDDFESYTVGAYLAKSNSQWSTWKNKPGTTEDVKISDKKAHGGTKSIYFTSTVPSGGPTDVILPFGGEYNTGNFTLDMWMYIEPTKVGYFNIQGYAKTGIEWTMETHFFKDGTFNIVSTNDGPMLRGSYTGDQWMNVKLEMNLNTGTWELFIDGTSKGTFSPSFMQIGSINFFAAANSGFFIDDISYNYTPYTVPALNAALTGISYSGGKLAGQKIYPSIKVRNLGTTPITSLKASLTYNGSTIDNSVTGLNIASMDTYSIKLTSPVTLAAGSNAAVINLIEVNGNTGDDDNSDNSKSVILDPIVPAADKMVLVEEATGTWCPWCVRGTVFMEKMDQDFDGYFVGVAVHNNDPMMEPTYDAGIQTVTDGWPSVVVDRGLDVDPSGMEPDIMNRVMVAPKGVMVNGANYDNSTGLLKVSVTTTFKEATSGEYKIAVIITEDGVTGSDAGYDQANAYAGGGQGKMGGFENLPNPVPADQMVYDHVARAIAPDFFGMGKTFPMDITANSSFTHTTLFVLNGVNTDNMHIIGVLIGPDGLVDNTSSASLSEAVANGYKEGTVIAGVTEFNGPDSRLSIYPNPAADMVNLPALQGKGTVVITDISGKEVFNQEMSFNGDRKQISLSGLNNGVYMIRVLTADKVFSSKLIKQ